MTKLNKFKSTHIFGVSVFMVALVAGTIFNSLSIDGVFGKPVDGGKKNCKSDFFSRTCCWAESNGYFIFERCETCIDNGDGTYGQCKTDDHPFKTDESGSNIEHDDNRVPNDDGVLADSQDSDVETNNQVPLGGGGVFSKQQ